MNSSTRQRRGWFRSLATEMEVFVLLEIVLDGIGSILVLAVISITQTHSRSSAELMYKSMIIQPT